jgi:hypothetical protein
MTTARPPRRTVSTGTWEGLSVQARADLDASEHAHAALDVVAAHVAAAGAELSTADARSLRSSLVAIIRAAYARGAEREQAHQVRAEAEQALRLRYERAMLEAGVPLPRLGDG